jgi:biopolymer transport protein ExbB/TolQ
MFSAANLSDTLRAVSSSLQIPVICVLLAMIAVVIVMAGTLLVEAFTERLRLRAKLPGLVDKIRKRELGIEDIIQCSGLLRRQKNILLELTKHKEITPAMRESLAMRLIFQEREHYDSIVKITDVISRLGPMFGLLGTLIPLGPGIIALGRGDTYTLSTSFLTAFDTTVAGLISAAIAYLISAIRKKWYGNYMSALELVMECVLEIENTGN